MKLGNVMKEFSKLYPVEELKVILGNYQKKESTYNETDLQLKEIFNDCTHEKES